MKIAAVIPAYNEEKTIRDVLKVVKQVALVDEIIVVDDGSADRTAEMALQEGVKVISLGENRGKGAAVKEGFETSEADIILFLDADLLNLTPDHILELLLPVIGGEADMALGVFEAGRFSTDFAQKIAPQLTGQRAVKRDLLKEISCLELTRFGFEKALTLSAKRNDAKVVYVKFQGVSHVMKEEKLGPWNGFKARMKMYWEIFKPLR